MDLLRSDEFWDPHAIAGLLKSFFRDLPSSILTRDLHMRFLSVMGTLHIPHICKFALVFPFSLYDDLFPQTWSILRKGLLSSRILSRSCQSQITPFFVL